MAKTTLEQIKEAFSTLVMDDSFLSDEERQMELLRHLREHMRMNSRRTDVRLAELEEEAQNLRH